MTKVVLADLQNLQNETTAVDTINDNNQSIVEGFDNTLSLDGSEPNQMQADLDMNSNQILNLPVPSSNFSPVRLIDLNGLETGGTITVDPLPAGGTTGQILTKNTDDNYDVSWEDPVLPGTTTGTGAVVLQNTPTINSPNIVTPTLVSPNLGTATANSINKVTITQPANNATLTINDGKTLHSTASLTLSGTDNTTQTFPNTSGNVVTTSSVNTITNGMLAQMPTQTIKGNNSLGTGNAQDLTVTQFQAMLKIGGQTFVGDTNYQITVADTNIIAGGALTAPRTWTLPKASTYPVGSELKIYANAGVINGFNQITIAPFAGDSLAENGSIVLTTSRDGLKLISDGFSDWKTILPDSRLITTRFSPTNAGTNINGSNDRTVHLKLYETISVLDFGAVGDGASDNSAAFTAISAYCVGKNVRIRIPNGQYKTSTQWVFDGNTNIIIEGEGMDIAALIFSGGTGGILYGSTSNSGWTYALSGNRPYFAVKDLTLFNIANGGTGITCYMPYGPSQWHNDFDFDHLNIACREPASSGESWDNGIYVYNAWRGSITRCCINQRVNKMTGVGIYLDGLSPGIFIQNNITQFWDKAVQVGGTTFNGFNGGTLTGSFTYGEIIRGNTSGATMRYLRPSYGGLTVVGYGTGFTAGETVTGLTSGATLTAISIGTTYQGNEGIYANNNELILCNYAFYNNQPSTFGTPSIGMWITNSNLTGVISSVYGRYCGQWFIQGCLIYNNADNCIDIDIDGANNAMIENNIIMANSFANTIAIQLGGTIGFAQAVIKGNFIGNRTFGILLGSGFQQSEYPSDNSFQTVGTNITVVSVQPLFGNGCFSAYNAANQTSIPNATSTKLTGLTTEVYDQGNNYDATNSRWTPPRGRVNITGGITYTGGVVAGGGIAAQLWKNGAYYKSLGFAASPGTTGAITGSAQDFASGTDYYELYCFADGTGTKTVVAGPISTFFQGQSIK